MSQADVGVFRNSHERVRGEDSLIPVPPISPETLDRDDELDQCDLSPPAAMDPSAKPFEGAGETLEQVTEGNSTCTPPTKSHLPSFPHGSTFSPTHFDTAIGRRSAPPLPAAQTQKHTQKHTHRQAAPHSVQHALGIMYSDAPHLSSTCDSGQAMAAKSSFFSPRALLHTQRRRQDGTDHGPKLPFKFRTNEVLLLSS